MKYNEATAMLSPAWEAYRESVAAVERAKAFYFKTAESGSVRVCTHCSKPMPDYDNSWRCDGCHLPWGWDTPQARRDRRAAELDAEIKRLSAERAEL